MFTDNRLLCKLMKNYDDRSYLINVTEVAKPLKKSDVN